MKSVILALGLTWFGLPTVGLAQDMEEFIPVEIVNSQPSSVWVEPGGKADRVRVYGRGFELVRKVEVRRNGARAAGINAKIRNISQGIAELEVQAEAAAEPGKDYELIFYTPTASYPMRLDFEVVGPEQ
jgi:hypothetical protein